MDLQFFLIFLQNQIRFLSFVSIGNDDDHVTVIFCCNGEKFRITF